MEIQKTNRTENVTFRMLYLIAILFVVDGHIPLDGELLNFSGLFRYYSFHMLLFAFGSGYFFNTERSYLSSLRRDCTRLLLPLYLYNLIYGLLAAGLRKFFHSTLGEPLSFYTLVIAPVMDGQHFSYNTGAWFLGALFFVKLLYRTIYELFRRLKVSDLLSFLVSLAVGSMAVLYSRNHQVSVCSFPLPLFIIRAMILLPGYALGHIYRERLERRDTLPSLIYLTVIILLRVLFTTLVSENTYLISDLSYIPCGPVGIYVGGALAIAFYLRISRILAPHLSRNTILTFISRHTFDIMMNHGLGIFCVNVLFLILNKFHLGARDFSIAALRTAPGYVYAPNGAPEWAVLYILAGIAFSCVIAFGSEKIRSNKTKKTAD